MKKLSRQGILKADMLGMDPLRSMLASDILGTDAGEEGVQFLIERLKSSNMRIRYLAATGIYEGKCQQALEPLLDAIFDPANEGTTDTLAFALKALDCTGEFLRVFDILFHHHYAAKLAALTVLREQEFKVTDDEREVLREKWSAILGDPSLCPEFEYARVDIEDVLRKYEITFSDPTV